MVIYIGNKCIISEVIENLKHSKMSRRMHTSQSFIEIPLIRSTAHILPARKAHTVPVKTDHERQTEETVMLSHL